jgi:hypothetical protein
LTVMSAGNTIYFYTSMDRVSCAVKEIYGILV